MRVLIFVLNDSDFLQPVLNEFNSIGIKGCTILDTNGMGRELAKKGDVFNMMFGSLRNMLTPDLKPSKLLMLVLDESRMEAAIAAYEKVVGNLDEPGTGIAFAFPLDYVKGIKL